jgi:hypothetical protein
MADAVKSKTFSMVAAICSFVVGGFAVISAIYGLVGGFQAFGDTSYSNHILLGIYGLLEAVIELGIAAVGIFLGLKLLIGSKLPLSTNPLFNRWFFFIAGLFEISVVLEFLSGLSWNNSDMFPSLFTYFIYETLFLVGTIVMMVISKGKSGLNSSIFFFIGIGCFLFADGYTFYGAPWYGILLSLAFIGFEVMAVLARVLEDKLGK